MKRIQFFLVFICLIAPSLFVNSASALSQESGYCSVESVAERVIIGASDEAIEAYTLGKWELTKSGLKVAGMAGERDAFWFMKEAGPQNGFLRVRWRLGERGDGSVFWRANFTEDQLPMVSGYSISVETDKLLVHRWDEGTPRQMASSLDLDLKTTKSLEFVIFYIGTQFSIQIYDAETLNLLKSFVLSDSAYLAGHLGFRAYRRQSKDSVWEHVSVIDAATTDPSTENLPIGAMRYVWLSASERENLKIPETCQALDSAGVEPQVYKCSHSDFEVLRRRALAAGLQLRAQGEVTQALLDKNFRQMKPKWPVEDETGFDVLASYMDAEMVESLLRAYAKKFPKKARLVRIGKSVQGRGIYALVIGRSGGGQKPTIMLNGAHHGMELMATDFVFDTIDQLLENPENNPEYERFVNELEIWCIPLVNPDGNHLYFHKSMSLGRKNGRDTLDEQGNIRVGAGVDLNRNYPFRWGVFKEKASSSKPKHYWYRGEKPASEPETQAMMNLVNAKQFTAAISYHTVSTKILVPYSIEGLTNPSPDEAWGLAQEMAKNAGVQSNGKSYEVRKNIYSVDGTDQDWFRYVAGTSAFLVEGAQHNPLKIDVRRKTVEANRGAWETLLRRALVGPSIYGSVKDSQGRALVAKVEILDITYSHGEHWASRCSDGAFERFVPGAGNYRVRVSIGDVAKEVSVSVAANERKMLNFVLERPEKYSLQKNLCPNKEQCSNASFSRARKGKCPSV